MKLIGDERTAGAFLAALLCAAVALIFWPILHTSFFLDDLVRLYDLSNFGLTKLLLSPYGGHLLVASNGVYALFQSLFGLEPSRWFAAVLILHAANILLLHSLLRRLGCGRLVSVAAAALWGLCPVHAESLAWIAVFGHVMLGTFALLLLRDMAVALREATRPSGLRLSLWWLLAVLAATSFAPGIGLAMALPFAALLLLPGLPGRRRIVWALGSLLLATPALYAAQHALYDRLYDLPLFMTPEIAPSLSPENFARRLAYALWLTLDLVINGLAVLLLGFAGFARTLERGFGLSTSPEAFIAWLGIPAAVLVAFVMEALRRAPRRLRSQALGMALLTFAMYGTFAAGGMLIGRLETLRVVGWTPARMIAVQALTPRYHYAAVLFLTTILALAAQAVSLRGPGARRRLHVLMLVVLVWLAFRAPRDRALVASTVAAHSLHRGAIHRLEADVERSPASGTVYLPNTPVGKGLLSIHSAAFPGRAALCVIYYPDGIVRGRTVRFVEPNADLLSILQAQTGTPISRLVVAPETRRDDHS
jgi:hypothetical protein